MKSGFKESKTDDVKGRKMTELGVAPLIAVPSFAYLAATIVLHAKSFPMFAFTATPGTALWIGGAVLIAFGLVMLLSSGLRIPKAFREGRLLTDGFFAVFPNPMYAAFVLLLVPGLALLLDSWLVLIGSAMLYILFRIFIRGEDRWLSAKFGLQYEEYRRRVPVKFL
jgi:protein-S-isoprenylcysteine O-methyltransferase Ste14